MGCQPGYLDFTVLTPQFPGNSQIFADMPQSDGAADVKNTLFLHASIPILTWMK
jgi:hypothetical protein